MSNPDNFESKLIDINGLVLQDQFYYRRDEPNYKICKPQSYKYNKGTRIEFLRFKRNSSSKSDEFDSINFSIRRFYKLKRDLSRLYVVIYGNDRKTGEFVRFECYSSISDGSFWRFCIKDEGEERLDKGYNYISSTFINIYLQNFINENIRNFEITENDDLNIKCIKTSELNEYLKNRISNDTYVSCNTFFFIMNKIFPPVTYMKYYEKCLSTLLKDLAVYIENNKIEEINICSDIFCLLHQNSLNKHITITEETSRRVFFTKIKKVFSELFLKYFTLKMDTKKKIFEKNFNVGEYNFISITYSIEIEYKLIPGKIYILYYMIYKCLSGDINKNKIFKTFIHIVPETVITIWGLDERYVAAGVMINKVFDYQKQAHITVLKGHKEENSSGYRFIGDLTNYEFLPE